MCIMGKKIDRTGEEGYNSFGSKMIIKEYRGALDIDVYFPDYDWTAEHTRYGDFKKEKINKMNLLNLLLFINNCISK